ncbi:MAG TPA: sigma-70 family RNA polymerase sigma factor [Trebonia sp.]|nr:sigma-70 family RNA polymerase sigma factor [Trebonia sp.]
MTHTDAAQTAGLPDRSSSPAHSAAVDGSGLSALGDSELAGLLQDPEHSGRAREVLVHRYRPMVRGLAGQYQVPAEHREDLVQVGYVGLMKAINSFDPAIREELKPYARVCVSGEMKRFFRDKRWLIRVSRTDQELLLAAKRAQTELAGELGSTPPDEQIASRLDVNVDDLRHAYRAQQAFAPASLDAPVGGDDDRVSGEIIGADDEAFDQSIDMDSIRQHWDELPRNQRRVLLLRFYGNMTQAQVAGELHCSQMHVSRLQARALAFLRGRLTAG